MSRQLNDALLAHARAQCRHFLVALTWPRNIVCFLFHAALSEQVGGHNERARALDLQEWRGEKWEGGKRMREVER
jgi:hypothetical protein